jgi:hypothetical protein
MIAKPAGLPMDPRIMMVAPARILQARSPVPLSISSPPCALISRTPDSS